MKKMFFYLLLLGNLSAVAQKGKINKAEAWLQNGEYEKVIVSYLTILDKRDDAEVKIKLADIYRLTENWQEAAFWYEQVIHLSEIDSSFYWYYSLALAHNNKCDLAKEWLAFYEKTKPSNNTLNATIDSVCANSKKKFLKSTCQNHYELMPTAINSKGNDVAPVFYQNGIVFSSDKNDLKSSSWLRPNTSAFTLFYTQIDTIQQHIYLYQTNEIFTRDFLDSNQSNISISFSQDEKTVLVAQQTVSEDAKITIFEHQNIDNNPITFQSLPFNSTDFSIANPCITPNGQRLYFSSDMAGGYGSFDIYYSDKQADGTWSNPANLGSNINTEGSEIFPYWHEQSKTLYFATDGLAGFGAFDIFYTTMKTNGFASPKNMGLPINSERNDYSFLLNADGSFGYFASDRKGGLGGMDIYSFEKNHVKSK